MAATAIIKSIERQGVMSDDEFAWVKERLHKPLQLLSVNYNSTGELEYVVIRKGPKETDILLIFKETNRATITVRGVDRRYE